MALEQESEIVQTEVVAGPIDFVGNCYDIGQSHEDEDLVILCNKCDNPLTTSGNLCNACLDRVGNNSDIVDGSVIGDNNDDINTHLINLARATTKTVVDINILAGRTLDRTSITLEKESGGMLTLLCATMHRIDDVFVQGNSVDCEQIIKKIVDLVKLFIDTVRDCIFDYEGIYSVTTTGLADQFIQRIEMMEQCMDFNFDKHCYGVLEEAHFYEGTRYNVETKYVKVGAECVPKLRLLDTTRDSGSGILSDTLGFDCFWLIPMKGKEDTLPDKYIPHFQIVEFLCNLIHKIKDQAVYHNYRGSGISVMASYALNCLAKHGSQINHETGQMPSLRMVTIFYPLLISALCWKKGTPVSFQWQFDWYDENDEFISGIMDELFRQFSMFLKNPRLYLS